MLIILAGCSDSKKQNPVEIKDPVLEIAPSQIAALKSDMPAIGGVHGYAGSESCKDCHKNEHASWYRTYHRTMTQVANTDTVLADFNNIVLTNETTRFHLQTNGNALTVTMQPRIVPDDADIVPSFQTKVSLVTGSHHMQVFWLPEGAGNLQIGFPFTWLIPEKRWAPRESTFIRPPEAPHRPEVWNIVCSRCHTTAVEPHVNIAARTSDTKVGELGISCEACHGPGEQHITWHKEQLLQANVIPEPPQTSLVNSTSAKGNSTPPEKQDPIIQPKDLTAERSSQVCGFCHSMKWMDKTDNWRESGFHYRPGDDLELTTPIIRPSTADDIPALAEYLQRNPNILRDFFWPDGMVRVSGREFNGLIESPCYKSKQFSCVSCHSMHKSEPAGLVAERATGNGACTQCHTQYESTEELTRHTRHSPHSSGSSCYNCHMPFTTYGVLKAIRSHQISSPNVESQQKSGRPNACNLCHLDQTLEWTANTLSGWYGHQIPELSAADRNVASSVNLALKGDAGQRALLAWHLGWEEALKASGQEWTPVVLAQLLDDPYAAVRCVAERSLKKISNLTPSGYDFATAPQTREPVRSAIWENWQKLGSTNRSVQPRLLLYPANLEQQKLAYEELINQRDNRPVRLRE
ncbi:MAG: multiheme c-type cytochrome [Verrucomicrobiales bacterium]